MTHTLNTRPERTRPPVLQNGIPSPNVLETFRCSSAADASPKTSKADARAAGLFLVIETKPLNNNITTRAKPLSKHDDVHSPTAASLARKRCAPIYFRRSLHAPPRFDLHVTLPLADSTAVMACVVIS